MEDPSASYDVYTVEIMEKVRGQEVCGEATGESTPHHCSFLMVLHGEGSSERF